MDAMLEEYRQIAESCRFVKPTLAIVSTVQGTLDAPVTTPEYWVHQARGRRALRGRHGHP
jgi:acyl transferase domain-containing protein